MTRLTETLAQGRHLAEVAVQAYCATKTDVLLWCAGSFAGGIVLTLVGLWLIGRARSTFRLF